MNVKQLVGGMFAAAMMTGAVIAQEAEKNEWVPSLDLNLTYKSRYTSQGEVLNPKSMLFWDATLSLKGFYVGVWFANDLNDYNRDSKISHEPEEVDYYFGWGHTFKDDAFGALEGISIDLGYTYWDMPKRSGWMAGQHDEYHVKANLECLLAPGIEIDWDPRTERWYGNLNVSWSYDFAQSSEDLKGLSFDTGCKLYVKNNHKMGNWHHDNDLHFANLDWTYGFSYAFNEHVKLSVFGEMIFAIDPLERKYWKGEYDPNSKSGVNHVWGSNLNFSF